MMNVDFRCGVFQHVLTGTLLLGLLSCPAFGAAAHEDEHEHAPAPANPADTYRPSVLPDRVILTWTGDPATTQSVNWRTSTAVAAGQACAEIALAGPGPDFVKSAQRVAATSQPLTTDLGDAHYHTVTFEGLSPATKYAYRVGDGVNWSEWFHFTTASHGAEPFSFIYFGDAQNDIRSMWSRVIREAYSDAPRARFMIHAGDLINTAESDAQWGEWFGAGHWLNAMIPSVPVPGNHEHAKLDEEGTKRRLSHHWRAVFALPEHGPAGLEETCYTLTYHNLRIIGLNSNSQLDTQAAWLDQVLSANTSPWVICTFHHPIFSSGKDRDNPELRGVWKPVFDKYRVDLVLQGHDHTYARTGLETPLAETVGNVPTGVNKIDAQTGTVYVVSVSGPKMYNLNRKPFMQRAAEDTQLYQIIHIHGDTLRYEARTAVGALYDAFVLEKRPGQINELIESDAGTPERLRPPAAAEDTTRELSGAAR
ncbi:MAG: metallophosphoesterase family protein [Pirellulaceae bacterium]|jgi:3',5'-cyclic AMP phosphodiesterase CpdA|nr:metallophosphoesterase family protein [Pirellulaceae bacterium]